MRFFGWNILMHQWDYVDPDTNKAVTFVPHGTTMRTAKVITFYKDGKTKGQLIRYSRVTTEDMYFTCEVPTVLYKEK